MPAATAPGLQCGTNRPVLPSVICSSVPLSRVAMTGSPAAPGLADHMRHPLASREPYEDIEPGQQARHIRAITEEIEQSAEPEIARKGAEFVIVLRHKRIGPADHQEAR